ncbi:putative murein hydrolase (TIGR00659 family) [Paenibacillus phyllosphaerae]|uniref:Putative murein hydrolase (TIGR00659 family) n=1 Tax=Paenibacillus phyllosphaerae TaxID=274593 RepID=A0A7W5B3U0_9BACL|nr:LrgB family protein [Paenibacillus phyllosphaerae]MBB3113913.1 putative murein hydrolase (TIGR00659 family) [Paenibacillus phyllosphaerae]
MWGHEVWSMPVFGVAATIGVFELSLQLSKRYRWIHPLLLCSVILIVMLSVLDIPYEDYNQGGSLITFLLGPATVALALPLYRNWQRIMEQWLPILVGVTLGACVSLAGNAAIVLCLGGNEELAASMMPKSATTPIALELVRLYGGVPELGAVFTVLTGLFGSLVGVSFLRLIGVRSDRAIGLAVGTAAHGIGTAKVMRDSQVQGAYAGLAMGVMGVVMTVLSVPVTLLFFR